MLSRQIYSSWNAKTINDLKDLLSNIEGPRIPDNVQTSAFKVAVLKKIEKRRLDERRRSLDREFDFLNYDEFDGRKCCSCRKAKDKGNQSKICECKSLAAFESICSAAQKRFTKSISATKALIQKLSYWESVKPGTDGLSVVGGYIWLLSYTYQHLIDGPNTREEYRMQNHIHEIKELYQILAQAGELFLEMATSFHENILNMRMEGLQVLKKLTKKWKIDDHYNPLLVRTEIVKMIPRPRKRLGNGLDSPIDIDDDDDVFAVKWSPLVVFVQMSHTESMKPFGKIHPQDRVNVFVKFLKRTLDIVEMAAEDVTVIAKDLKDIKFRKENTEVDHTGRELTAAMLEFSKSNNYCPKSLEDKDKRRLVILLNEFWYSLDVLYENIFILMRLVEETRNIIRTCYVYSDIFYKWHMPSYDCFVSNFSRKSVRSSTMGGSALIQAKEMLHRLTPSDKKFSETTSILSLMDFSSCIYQGVVQEIPVVCGEITLCLKTADNMEQKEEPMGLVSGIVDKRKSISTVHIKYQ